MARRSIGRSGELLIDDAALGASQLSGLGRSRNSGRRAEARAGTQPPGAASNRLPHGILCNPAPSRGVDSSSRTLNDPAPWPRRTRRRCSSASSRDSASSSRSRGCPSSWYPKPSVSWRFVYKRSRYPQTRENALVPQWKRPRPDPGAEALLNPFSRRDPSAVRSDWSSPPQAWFQLARNALCRPRFPNSTLGPKTV